MAQLHCGILPLRIETDRFEGESPDERLCKQCAMAQPLKVKNIMVYF